MASMAIYLRSRPNSFLRASSRAHFSSSSSTSSSDSSDEAPQNTPTNTTSSLKDVISRLKGNDRPSPQQGFSFSQAAGPHLKPPSVEFDEIKKNLSAFSRRSPDPSSSTAFQPPPLSFQDLYKQMSEASLQRSGSDNSPKVVLDNIRQKLNNQNPTTPKTMSLSKFKETLNLRSQEGTKPSGMGVIRESLPSTIFDRELKANRVQDANALCKDYKKVELGEKLRKLRQESQDSFSLTELNERLIKLRELELQQQSPNADRFHDLRGAIQMAQFSGVDSENKNLNQRVGIVANLGAATKPMGPPKEALVEKYYHPDNMSSAEKLKLKLKAVRDELKMSETDCGSTRVQIAQLTTEILHLSKVLHKKDKHSLKGLLAKVQLRKKLLKYLRRTDWDSYCFILSKLGLRDNPGYKQH